MASRRAVARLSGAAFGARTLQCRVQVPRVPRLGSVIAANVNRTRGLIDEPWKQQKAQPEGGAPKIDRSRSKVYKDADEAVADIKSGSTILSAGFGLCGTAGNCHHTVDFKSQC